MLQCPLHAGVVEESLQRIDGQAAAKASWEVEESSVGRLDSKGAPEVRQLESGVLPQLTSANKEVPLTSYQTQYTLMGDGDVLPHTVVHVLVHEGAEQGPGRRVPAEDKSHYCRSVLALPTST